MEEQIKRKLSDLQDCIESAESYLYDAREELDGLWDKLEDNSNTRIKDINNFRRELKRDGLYSEKIEDFLESYMKYYNK